MTAPFFSIVIPIFNIDEGLYISLNSVFNQDFKDFEVIVVDSLNNEEVRTLCSKYKGHFDLVYFGINNISKTQAIKKGIDISRGQYVSYLYVGDIIEEKFLEKFYLAIQNSELKPDWLSCHVILQGSNQVSKHICELDQGIFDNKIMLKSISSLESSWSMVGKTFRKDLLSMIWDGLLKNVNVDCYIDKIQFVPILLQNGFFISIKYVGYICCSSQNSFCMMKCTSKQFEKNINHIHKAEILLSSCIKTIDPGNDIIKDVEGLLTITIDDALKYIDKFEANEYAIYFNIIYNYFNHADVINIFYNKYAYHLRDLSFDNLIFKNEPPKTIKTIGFIVGLMRWGGAERATALLATRLAQQGYKCILLTCEEETSEDYEYEASIIRYVLPLTLTRKERFNEIINISSKEHIDCMIIVDHFSNYCHQDLLACKDLGIYTIIQEHSSFFYPLYASIYGCSDNYTIRKPFYKISDAITCLSSYNELCWEQIGFKNAVYIPNLQTFKRRKYNYRTKISHQIFFSGRLFDIKGIKNAIYMMRNLVNLVPDAYLHVLGRFESLESEKTLRDLVKFLDLDDNIKFYGFVNDVQPIIEKCSIHIMCSVVEGAPMVLFEAKALSIPSVIFSLPYVEGTSESEGCISVPQNNVMEMASTINKLWLNPVHYNTLCEKASNSIDAFSEDIILSRWKDLFKCFIHNCSVPKFHKKVTETELLNATMEEMENGMSFIQKEFDNKKNSIEYLRSMEIWIDEQKKCIEATEQLVNERDHYIKDLEIRVNDQLSCINSSETMINERDNYIKDLEYRLDEQKACMTTSETMIIERDNYIKDLEEKLNYLTIKISNLTDELSAKNDIIFKYNNSKLIKAIRKLDNLIKK